MARGDPRPFHLDATHLDLRRNGYPTILAYMRDARRHVLAFQVAGLAPVAIYLKQQTPAQAYQQEVRAGFLPPDRFIDTSGWDRLVPVTRLLDSEGPDVFCPSCGLFVYDPSRLKLGVDSTLLPAASL